MKNGLVIQSMVADLAVLDAYVPGIIERAGTASRTIAAPRLR